MLRGERATEYVDAEGQTVPVCPLCKPRAEASGWVPAALAHTVGRPEPVRRRSPLNLRERIVRRVPASLPATLADDPEPEPRETEPPTALDVFNASQEVRKVAGLRRSLGEPRVSVRDGSAGNRIITVAWDLSWYQWSVLGDSIREVGKGNEISELPIEDREWNAAAAEDGTLTLA
jgi:hypothetical protein